MARVDGPCHDAPIVAALSLPQRLLGRRALLRAQRQRQVLKVREQCGCDVLYRETAHAGRHTASVGLAQRIVHVLERLCARALVLRAQRLEVRAQVRLGLEAARTHAFCGGKLSHSLPFERF